MKFVLLNDFSDLTSTYCTATFTDSEAQTNIQCNCVDKVYSDCNVITRHYHFNAFGQRNFTCAVHCTEIELRTILVSERSMTSTFLFLQNVDLSLELLVRFDLSRVAEYHTTLDFVLVDTAEQQTYVITSFTLVKNLAEHLNASNNRLLVLAKTEQLNFITNLNTASLDTASSNSSTTSD